MINGCILTTKLLHNIFQEEVFILQLVQVAHSILASFIAQPFYTLLISDPRYFPASGSKNHLTGVAGLTIPAGILSSSSTTRLFTRSALPAPVAIKITCLAALHTGRVTVILLGGGFGEFSIGTTHDGPLYSKSGCPGNKEHVCPSGPNPKNKKSNLGNPSDVSSTCHSRSLLSNSVAAC